MSDDPGPRCTKCPWDRVVHMSRGYVAQEITFTVGKTKQVRTLVMPGWYCGVCGDSIHSRADMKVSDAILDQMKRDQGL